VNFNNRILTELDAGIVYDRRRQQQTNDDENQFLHPAMNTTWTAINTPQLRVIYLFNCLMTS